MRGCLYAGTLIFITIIYGIWFEPYAVGVHHIWIRDGYLGKILGNKVVVQLSDLHILKIGKREQKVLRILSDLKPDIVFLTGDYVPWQGDYAPAMQFLSLLRARIGIWAVMGDYDYSSPRKSCIFCHEEGTGKPTREHSVRFLKDSRDLLVLPEGQVSILGFDGEGGDLFSPRKTSLPQNGQATIIILSHNPLAFDSISDNRSSLMLAGDTHGGQIPLPAWLFHVMGYKKNALYNQGLYERGRKKMFVSRGIGTSHLPIRLLRPPEVVVYHFQK